MQTGGPRMDKNRPLLIACVFLIVFSVFAICLVNENHFTPIKMQLVGDTIQEVEYEETVHYKVNVINARNSGSVVKLEIENVPKYWNASLDKKVFSLAGNSNTFVILSVSAPSLNAAGSEDLDTTAYIGVRGGNNSIGTITLLGGSATVTRDGSTFSLGTDDEIFSGDVVTTVGSPVIHLSEEKLKLAHGQIKGDIYILLNDATVGFLLKNKKVYLSLVSGTISIYKEGEDEETRSTASPISVNLTENDDVSLEFPELQYQSVVEIDLTSNVNTVFFSLGSNEQRANEELKVEVFKGEVEIINDVESMYLEEFAEVRVEKAKPFPESEYLKRRIVKIESNESVEASLSTNNINVLLIKTTRYFPFKAKKIYVIDSNLPDLTVELIGRKYGNFTVSHTAIEENFAKSWFISSLASLDTKDTYIFSPNRMVIKNVEKGRTLDLFITTKNLTSGEVKEFMLKGIKPSGRDISVIVNDWESLDSRTEKPVTISIGGYSVDVSSGTIWDEIEKQFTRLTTPTKVSLNLLKWIAIFLLPILALGAGYRVVIYGKSEEILFDSISIQPKKPRFGESANITAVIRNKGRPIKSKKQTITVKFYDENWLIEEISIDLSKEPFEKGKARKVTAEWLPFFPGKHTLFLTVDRNEKVTDRKTKIVYFAEEESIELGDRQQPIELEFEEISMEFEGVMVYS